MESCIADASERERSELWKAKAKKKTLHTYDRIVVRKVSFSCVKFTVRSTLSFTVLDHLKKQQKKNSQM